MSDARSSRQYVTIEEVYRRYGYDVLRFLHGAHPHLNHQDCEDLLHQAIVKAVTHMGQYDPSRGSLRLWLFGIVRNEVRQDLRARLRKPLEALGERDAPDARPSASAVAASADEVARVDAALAQLPFAEREALLAPIRTEGAATTEAIARRLGIAPGSVAVYRQRARARLRDTLAPRGDEQGGTSWWSARTRPARTRA